MQKKQADPSAGAQPAALLLCSCPLPPRCRPLFSVAVAVIEAAVVAVLYPLLPARNAQRQKDHQIHRERHLQHGYGYQGYHGQRPAAHGDLPGRRTTRSSGPTTAFSSSLASGSTCSTPKSPQRCLTSPPAGSWRASRGAPPRVRLGSGASWSSATWSAPRIRAGGLPGHHLPGGRHRLRPGAGHLLFHRPVVGILTVDNYEELMKGPPTPPAPPCAAASTSGWPSGWPRPRGCSAGTSGLLPLCL